MNNLAQNTPSGSGIQIKIEDKSELQLASLVSIGQTPGKSSRPSDGPVPDVEPKNFLDGTETEKISCWNRTIFSVQDITE